MNITEWNIWAQLGLVLLVVAARFGFERLVSGLFKKVKVESTSVYIFIKSIIMVVFNVVILLLCEMSNKWDVGIHPQCQPGSFVAGQG